MSTYIGGAENDMASAIAVDGTGVYVVGFTRSTEASFPIATGPGATHKGLDDAFVLKLSDGAPAVRIVAATKVGKKLVVTGEGFERGAQILVNGIGYKTKANKQTPTTKLQSGKAGKRVAPGDTITVRNPGGTVSNAITFAG
jgi:hypothetical protein